MPAISVELLNQMERTAAPNPQVRFPVIITLKADAAQDAVEQAGFRVENRFPVISAVSGSATLATLKRLADMEEVELIEEDGEVRAI